MSKCRICNKKAIYRQSSPDYSTDLTFCSLEHFRKFQKKVGIYRAFEVERIDGKKIASIGEP